MSHKRLRISSQASKTWGLRGSPRRGHGTSRRRRPALRLVPHRDLARTRWTTTCTDDVFAFQPGVRRSPGECGDSYDRYARVSTSSVNACFWISVSHWPPFVVAPTYDAAKAMSTACSFCQRLRHAPHRRPLGSRPSLSTAGRGVLDSHGRRSSTEKPLVALTRSARLRRVVDQRHLEHRLRAPALRALARAHRTINSFQSFSVWATHRIFDFGFTTCTSSGASVYARSDGAHALDQDLQRGSPETVPKPFIKPRRRSSHSWSPWHRRHCPESLSTRPSPARCESTSACLDRAAREGPQR